MRDSNTVIADLRFAILRQDQSAGLSSIREILEPIAMSAEYWSEVACALHRMKKHSDALDCWKAGETMMLQDQDLSNFMIEKWYHDMVETLFLNGDHNTDYMFEQEAFLAAERFMVALNCEGALELQIKIGQYLKKPRKLILKLIESLFEYEKNITIHIDPYVLGTNFPTSKIRNSNDLALCHLWNDSVSDAFRIWAKAEKIDEVDSIEYLSSIIFQLNQYAHFKQFDQNKYCPKYIFENAVVPAAESEIKPEIKAEVPSHPEPCNNESKSIIQESRSPTQDLDAAVDSVQQRYFKNDRVRHPTQHEWGIGIVIENCSKTEVKIKFENAGNKTLSLAHVKPIKILGTKKSLNNESTNNKFDGQGDGKVLCKNCGNITSFTRLAGAERADLGWCSPCYAQSKRIYKDEATGTIHSLDDDRTIDGIKNHFSQK